MKHPFIKTDNLDDIPFGLSYILMTPSIAALLLANNHNTRPINPYRVQELVSIIYKGNWKAFKGTVELSYRNHLLNGQHRLTAIIASNTSVVVKINKYRPSRIINSDMNKAEKT